jgi:SNF2 family DNA or RNA helicase
MSLPDPYTLPPSTDCGTEYGNNICYLSGQTKREESKLTTTALPLCNYLTMRIGQGIVDEFNQNDDMFVFLISTTAGGTGLNLVSANRVIVFG